eukprot:TRINITY_DN194_c0_g1_i9.p3 TRINITY_DN194_c0_g1~~TRINITY_DN194_c0_g1_i9.p3  ORF type:complete len:121 (+),score=5.24 TRINITY_DN194_c0_g1_i9:57-419(+)
MLNVIVFVSCFILETRNGVSGVSVQFKLQRRRVEVGPRRLALRPSSGLIGKLRGFRRLFKWTADSCACKASGCRIDCQLRRHQYGVCVHACVRYQRRVHGAAAAAGATMGKIHSGTSLPI